MTHEEDVKRENEALAAKIKEASDLREEAARKIDEAEKITGKTDNDNSTGSSDSYDIGSALLGTDKK